MYVNRTWSLDKSSIFCRRLTRNSIPEEQNTPHQTSSLKRPTWLLQQQNSRTRKASFSKQNTLGAALMGTVSSPSSNTSSSDEDDDLLMKKGGFWSTSTPLPKGAITKSLSPILSNIQMALSRKFSRDVVWGPRGNLEY